MESSVKPADVESLLGICSRSFSGIAVILLVDHLESAWTVRMLHSGASSILQRDASLEQVAAAIRGSAEELIVLTTEIMDEVLARSGVNAADLEPLLEELTPRELEVLRMVASGLANREIAARLGVSEHTIKFHISSILGKLGAASRTEAVAHGIKRGLVLL
jgi:DNA-binding NarL/FixJ family response regulator